MYAARTSADQRVATSEARLAEEIQRRRDAEAERDTARADREQADDATAQSISRMEEPCPPELAELRTSTEAEVREAPRQRRRRDPASPRETPTATSAPLAHYSPARSPTLKRSRRQPNRATSCQGPPSRSARHHPSRASPAASEAQETARIRTDHQRAPDQLTAATNARIKAVEETRDALRIRVERAETDLDSARVEIRRDLAEQLTQASQRRSRPGPGPGRHPIVTPPPGKPNQEGMTAVQPEDV